MHYFNVEEELQDFAETREREGDEARLASQPDAFVTMLYNAESALSSKRDFTPIHVEKVVLMGEKVGRHSSPTDYPEGYARVIVRAPTGQERPVEIRWDIKMMYPINLRFADEPVTAEAWA